MLPVPDALTGKCNINRASLKPFIASLGVPKMEKQHLLPLSPQTCIGKTAELTKRI